MAPRVARRTPAPPIAVIVGPTGSGKSDLAMAIAARQPAEIIVADSRQVYRGMDRGTAKPTPAERAAVPHHLIDLVDPDEPFTLADWLAAARAVVPQVTAGGRLPLLVGGTGLYVTALVDGYALPGGPPSPEVRRRLVEEMEAEGLAPLSERLRRDAPEIAATTDLRNPRRVIRALERAASGGDAAQRVAEPYAGRVALLGIRRPREELYRRIDARAAAMFAGGLLDEMHALRREGFGAELAPMTGHGYREAARVVAGEWSVDRAIEVTARHTRQYAKRQLSWLRRDARIVWLDAGDRAGNDPALVGRALDLLRRLLAG